tara:strand:- start:3801 stop:4094 length:294 start_codon:yes stop_codon:yes gene_type:complete
MSSSTPTEDSGLVYVVLFVCVLSILAFLLFKLYNKVNELDEKVHGINNENKLNIKKENPTVEEDEYQEEVPDLAGLNKKKDKLPEGPGPSKLPNQEK